jgi:hypothetical protein
VHFFSLKLDTCPTHLFLLDLSILALFRSKIIIFLLNFS